MRSRNRDEVKNKGLKASISHAIFDLKKHNLYDVLPRINSSAPAALNDFLSILDKNNLIYSYFTHSISILSVSAPDGKLGNITTSSLPEFMYVFPSSKNITISDYSAIINLLSENIDAGQHSIRWLGSWTHRGKITKRDIDNCPIEVIEPSNRFDVNKILMLKGKTNRATKTNPTYDYVNVSPIWDINLTASEDNPDMKEAKPFRADLFFIPTTHYIGSALNDTAQSSLPATRLKSFPTELGDLWKWIYNPIGYVITMFYCEQTKKMATILIPVYLYWLLTSIKSRMIELMFPSLFNGIDTETVMFWQLITAGIQEIYITPHLTALGHISSAYMANIELINMTKPKHITYNHLIRMPMIDITAREVIDSAHSLAQSMQPLLTMHKISKDVREITEIKRDRLKNKMTNHYNFEYMTSLDNGNAKTRIHNKCRAKFFRYKIIDNYPNVCIADLNTKLSIQTSFPKIEVWTQCDVAIYERQYQHHHNTKYHYFYIKNKLFVNNFFVSYKKCVKNDNK